MAGGGVDGVIQSDLENEMISSCYVSGTDNFSFTNLCFRHNSIKYIKLLWPCEI